MLEEQRITPNKVLEMCVETGYSLRQGKYVSAEDKECCAIGMPFLTAVGEEQAELLTDEFRNLMIDDIVKVIADATDLDVDYLRGMESAFENSAKWTSRGEWNEKGYADGFAILRAVTNGTLPGKVRKIKSANVAIDNVVDGVVPERTTHQQGALA